MSSSTTATAAAEQARNALNEFTTHLVRLEQRASDLKLEIVVYMYVFIYVFLYICMHVCTYVCIYICKCVYLCMYVCSCSGEREIEWERLH